MNVGSITLLLTDYCPLPTPPLWDLEFDYLEFALLEFGI